MANSVADIPAQLIKKLEGRFNNPEGLIPSGRLNFTEKGMPWYFTMGRQQAIAFHERLERLSQSVPSITVEYKKTGFAQLDTIKSLVIDDVRGLFDALDIRILSDSLSDAIDQVEGYIAQAPEWLQLALNELQTKWRLGKTLNGLSHTNHQALIIGVKFVSWLDRQQEPSFDMRTASVKALGDTKLLERNKPIIAKLLSLKDDSGVAGDPDEILERNGVSRFAPLIRIKGGITLILEQGIIKAESAYPYIAMPLETVSEIRISKPAPYILFIENLASFERYCREVHDAGVVIYTNGFPSRKWRKALAGMIATQCKKTTIYHWGDIDLGGYRILAHLNREFNGVVEPHMMTPCAATSNNDAQHLDCTLLRATIAEVTNNGCRKIAEHIISIELADGVIYPVEQESKCPSSPLQ